MKAGDILPLRPTCEIASETRQTKSPRGNPNSLHREGGGGGGLVIPTFDAESKTA